MLESMMKGASPREIDNMIEAQEKAIKQSIAEAQPLIGDTEPISMLSDVYRNNTRFHAKIAEVEAAYSAVRRARADGNCFFRALAFSWFERILPLAKTDIGRKRAAEVVAETAEDSDKDDGESRGDDNTYPRKASGVTAESPPDPPGAVPSGVQSLSTVSSVGAVGEENDFTRALALFRGSIHTLEAVGYKAYAVEDFAEVCIDLLVNMTDADFGIAELLERFQDRGTSDYIVCYLRVLCAGHIKGAPQDFLPFVQAMYPGLSLDSFCAAHVEAMAKDVDDLQITALTRALGVPCRIAYLDGSGGALNHHNFPEGEAPLAYLLFRPGHYDVLYPRRGSAKCDLR
jgi:hypothetical protein